MEQINTYLIKAIDSYPYDLEGTVEALQYAYSVDNKSPMILCLMGRVQADVFKNYELAKEYFNEALGEDIYAFDVYFYYIDVLLHNEDFEEAKRLIEFALTLKGSDKGVLYLKKAILLEHKKSYNQALKCLKTAKEFTYNSNFMSDVQNVKARIKSKMPKKKRKLKKKSKEEKLEN